MKQINTALASYGMSGIVFHGPLLNAHQGFRISKILERKQNNSAGKHPGSDLVRQFENILNDPETELIIINTPDYLHYEMSKRALLAGKHIIVEKPFTLKTSEADELTALAAKMGLMISVFQNRRWDGDFLTVKRVLKEGKLGRLVSFESHFDRFRNYIQASWKEEKRLGAGTLYNLGSHMIDQALHLFGMPNYLYADVRAQRTDSEVDDSFDLMLHYTDHKCLVRGSYLVKEAGPRYILHGTHGSFLKRGLDPQENDLKNGLIPGSKGWGEENEQNFGTINSCLNDVEIRQKINTIPGSYLAFYDNIYKHLREGEELAVKPSEGRNVIQVIEAAYKSSAEGKTVHF